MKPFIKTAQKLKFPLRISSVSLTKSTGNCRFDHVYWGNPQWKNLFFCAVEFISKQQLSSLRFPTKLPETF